VNVLIFWAILNSVSRIFLAADDHPKLRNGFSCRRKRIAFVVVVVVVVVVVYEMHCSVRRDLNRVCMFCVLYLSVTSVESKTVAYGRNVGYVPFPVTCTVSRHATFFTLNMKLENHCLFVLYFTLNCV
jgi:hypothetical protein